MALKIGIVGLPNVGKSTLFNALTKQKVLAENYPFATIDPNIGVVAVPDDRLTQLAAQEKSEKIIPTVVEFVDIAGLIKDAHKGEGLGNKFLSHIREVDAIAEVVRFFEDGDVHHVEGSIDGSRDIETIKTELILADLETVEKRMKALEADAKGKDKKTVAKLAVVKKVDLQLSEGNLAQDIQLDKEEKSLINDLHLLTLKPFMYIANVSGKGLPAIPEKLHDSTVEIDAKQEVELADFTEEEKKEYLLTEGISESGLDRLIKKAYETLNLITFFTAGPKESRAWTVTAGSYAPAAAGKIHTDFEHGFIKAEVVNWQDLLSASSWSKARDSGLIRTEGKDYVVQDGDVMIFKFNV